MTKTSYIYSKMKVDDLKFFLENHFGDDKDYLYLKEVHNGLKVEKQEDQFTFFDGLVSLTYLSYKWYLFAEIRNIETLVKYMPPSGEFSKYGLSFIEFLFKLKKKVIQR